MLRSYRIAALAGAMTIAAFPAMVQKASAQETLEVSAFVGNGCTITVRDLAFGIIDPVIGGNTGEDLNISCNPGALASVTLQGDGGLLGTAGGNGRVMALDGALANVSVADKNLDYFINFTPEGGSSTPLIKQATVTFPLDGSGNHTAALAALMDSQVAPQEGVYSDTISFIVGFVE